MMDLKALDEQKLFDLRASIDQELKRRGLSATIGDVGERLAIRHFANRSDLPVLAPAPRGTKNIDAISRHGERYSIKTLQKARKTGTVYPDPDVGEHPLFEYMLILLLSERCELQRIYRLTWAQFLKVRSWDKRMNAWYVARSERALGVAEDLT